ncbi:hypothetical protein M5D96_001066 [Drosophila gunungcola]|uniref:Uncharacterized protein n=1 Tax=Drosophila gunungcola TaxID=103775 RepID=A0A9P9YXF7_9MUSC|nr:hypothetical protein M5D96_001066 [Drosophila gunungcola]
MHRQLDALPQDILHYLRARLVAAGQVDEHVQRLGVARLQLLQVQIPLELRQELLAVRPRPHLPHLRPDLALRPVQLQPLLVQFALDLLQHRRVLRAPRPRLLQLGDQVLLLRPLGRVLLVVALRLAPQHLQLLQVAAVGRLQFLQLQLGALAICVEEGKIYVNL